MDYFFGDMPMTKEYAAQYRAAHPELREYNRAWRADHPEKCSAYTEKYRAKFPERRRLWINQYHRNKRNTNPGYKIRVLLSNRLHHAVTKQKANKLSSTMRLVGCDISFLMGHLQARFRPGMNWDNYGAVWEIDHKIPCVAFDLTDESQQRACFNFQNLQPLFKTENRRKWRHIER